MARCFEPNPAHAERRAQHFEQTASSSLETRVHCLEGAAREAFSSHIGRTLTDTEWARARKNLLEFAKILCTWARADERAGGGGINLMRKAEP